jgi:hypothetical protein
MNKSFFVVIIGLLSGAIAFLIHYIFFGLNDIPAIQTQVQTIRNAHSSGNAIIQVTNDGKVPVTNLNLTVKAPKGITVENYSNFSSVHLISNRINTTVLEAHVDKLVHGTGSIIYISIPINDNQSFDCNAYSAYAVYEEGSVKGHCSSFFDIVYQFIILHNSVKIGILVTVVVFLSTSLFMVIHKYVTTSIVRRKRR